MDKSIKRLSRVRFRDPHIGDRDGIVIHRHRDGFTISAFSVGSFEDDTETHHKADDENVRVDENHYSPWRLSFGEIKAIRLLTPGSECYRNQAIK